MTFTFISVCHDTWSCWQPICTASHARRP